VDGLGIVEKVGDGEAVAVGVVPFGWRCAVRVHDLEVDGNVVGQRLRLAFGVHEEAAIVATYLKALASESRSLDFLKIMDHPLAREGELAAPLHCHDLLGPAPAPPLGPPPPPLSIPMKPCPMMVRRTAAICRMGWVQP
jgi:hypothetical protein